MKNLLCLPLHGHSGSFLHVQLRVGVTLSPRTVYILRGWGQHKQTVQELQQFFSGGYTSCGLKKTPKHLTADVSHHGLQPSVRYLNEAD